MTTQPRYHPFSGALFACDHPIPRCGSTVLTFLDPKD